MNTKFTFITTDAITVWEKCTTYWEEFEAIFFSLILGIFSKGKKLYFGCNLRQTILSYIHGPRIFIIVLLYKSLYILNNRSLVKIYRFLGGELTNNKGKEGVDEEL